MTYTFNYTGRELIDRNLITLSVNEQDGRVCLTGKLDLTNHAYPDGIVKMEAYRRNARRIAELGPATGEVALDWTFDRFAPLESIMYVIKVVAASGNERNKLLAVRNQVRPDKGVKGFLATERADLGQELWRLDDESDDELPVLQISSRLDDIGDLAWNPTFRAIVMPGIARSLGMWLFRQLGSENEGDHTDDLAEFFRGLGVTPAGDDDAWVDEAVATFSSKHAFVDQWLTQKEDEA